MNGMQPTDLRHNLFGELGPICYMCSGLGWVLRMGSSDFVTKSASRCTCGGTGVDLDATRLSERQRLEKRLADLELKYAKLLSALPPAKRRLMNTRQFWMECIAWATADGTAVHTSTAEAIIFPNVTIPSNYMQDGRALDLKLSGRIGATATPTMTFRLRWGGLSGTVLAASAAVTLAAVTAAIFRIELELQTRSNGATGSIFAMGVIHWGQTIKTTNTPDMMGSAGATTPAAVTADLSADTPMSVTAQWSASNAANTLTGHNYHIDSKN